MPGPTMVFGVFCDGTEVGAGGGPSPGPELPSDSGGPPI